MRSHVSKWLVSLGAALFCSLIIAPALTIAQPRRVPPRRQAPRAAVQKRIVVERFSGPQAARVRAGLMADLADHADTLTIVSDAELRTAVEEAGVARLRSAADYATVAEKATIAAFVDGRVARRGRSWALTVRVRSGLDGSILGTETWSGGTMNALGAVRRNGHSRLAQYFELARAPAAHLPEATERPWYQQVTPPEPVENAEDADDEEDDDERPEGENRYSVFRVGVGAGTLRRSMSTEIIPLYGATGLETEGPAEPRSYESAGIGHGELGIEGEFFPGAFGPQPFPYMGLAFSYRASVGLQSTGCAPPRGIDVCPEDVTVKSSQTDFYLGMRSRYAVGGPARGPELTFDLGYGYFGFTLDLAALAELDPSSVIPPVGYSYLHLGIGVSYPAIPTYLVLGARLAYRLSLGVSAEQKQVWGTTTSSAPGFLLGLDVKSGMPYVVPGLYVAFAFQYFSFSTTFEGDTACMTSTCTPWTSGVAGSPWQPLTVPEPVSDGYVRLALSVGYEFR